MLNRWGTFLPCTLRLNSLFQRWQQHQQHLNKKRIRTRHFGAHNSECKSEQGARSPNNLQSFKVVACSYRESTKGKWIDGVTTTTTRESDNSPSFSATVAAFLEGTDTQRMSWNCWFAIRIRRYASWIMQQSICSVIRCSCYISSHLHPINIAYLFAKENFCFW